jgi:multiple sugar transport system permease protein
MADNAVTGIALATSPTSPTTITTGSLARRRRTNPTPYLMLIPAIALFAIFMAAPIAYTLYLSFQKMRIVGLGLGPNSQQEVFAGFENYVAALGDPTFLQGVARIAVYGLILVPVMLGLALLFALQLDSRRSRARGFSRIAIFLPYAVPGVIASLIWGFLYLPGTSPLYDIASGLGIKLPSIMEGDPVIVAVANIAIWGGVGFNMVVLYTALRSIPTELYEAARLDGASEVQIALRVKVPIIVPSLVLTAIFSMISTLQVFNEPNTLRPLTNSISTTFTPMMKVYRDAFIRNDIYTASATSIIIAIAIFALSFGFLRLIQRRAFAGEGNNQ